MRIAFKILEDGQELPPAYQYMDCHMIFMIKLDSFKRKARLVVGRHMIQDPSPTVMTYASIVSRDSVRIALMLAACHAE